MRNKGDIKIVNIKHKPNAFYTYIGRQNTYLGLAHSKWANPKILKRELDRDNNLHEYLSYVISRIDLTSSLIELTGKTLGCYCCNYDGNNMIGKKCHGMTLIALYDYHVKNTPSRWRALLRVTEIFDYSIVVFIPGSEIKYYVIPKNCFPIELGNRLKIDYRFYAKLNLDAINGSELYLSDFEIK